MSKMPKVEKLKTKTTKMETIQEKPFLNHEMSVKVLYFFFPMEVKKAKSSLHSL